MRQACSQACASEVAKFSQRNHVVQILRAYPYFMLLESMGIIYVLGKIELASMSQGQDGAKPKFQETYP